MGFQLDNDIDEIDANKAESTVRNGGLLPAGRYHVRLAGATDAMSKSSSATGTKLMFDVISGPHAGAEISDTIWNSDKPAAKNRVLLFSHRLGLLAKKDGKYVRVPGKEDACDCTGVEVVIDVTQEPYTLENGKTGASNKIAFGGIYGMDEKESKELLAGKSPSSPSASGASAKPAAPTKAKPKVSTAGL